MLSIEILRYSSGFSPALRTVSVPFVMCLPFAQNSIPVQPPGAGQVIETKNIQTHALPVVSQ